MLSLLGGERNSDLNLDDSLIQEEQGLWVFGYGSLIWNPGFDFQDRRMARLPGWTLRFWQASMDHRGTPEAPGRVATLVRDALAETCGVVYRIAGDPSKVLSYLDEREKGGYSREFVHVSTSEGEVRAVTYIGGESAQEFIGPEAIETTAEIILGARGPSGDNLYYFQELCKSLEENFSLPEYLHELRNRIIDRHF